MELKPKTKQLIGQANELLAIWQEQEKANDRAWNERKLALDTFYKLIDSGKATAEEIFAAYDKWRALEKFECALPTHYDAQQEWAVVRAKAQIAICEDAGLLRSEEEKSYDKEEDLNA